MKSLTIWLVAQFFRRVGNASPCPPIVMQATGLSREEIENV